MSDQPPLKFEQRSPVEVRTGMVRVAVHAQRELDGTWVASVPGITTRCQSGPTREDAVRAALEEASIPEGPDEDKTWIFSQDRNYRVCGLCPKCGQTHWLGGKCEEEPKDGYP